MIYYIVMKRSWEFDDERYVTPDDNAGMPHNVFVDDPHSAIQACLKLNTKALQGFEFGEYGWPFDRVCPEEFPELVIGDSRWNQYFRKDLTEEQALKVLDMIREPEPFYFIYKLEVSGGETLATR